MINDEIEVEWRRRLSMTEAQRLLWHVLRGRERIFVEEYRVRHHGEVHRRLGLTKVFERQSFQFNTYDELLSLFNAPLSHRPASKATTTVRSLSLMKIGTCFHTRYYFDPCVGLAENNKFPRVFCCKRSREIVDDATTMIDDPQPPNDSLEALEARLRDLECFEMDRSDNNLGIRFYRKIYYLTETNVRFCLYAILDEFGTVRYELGVEREVDSSSSSTTVPNALLTCYMSQCSAVIHESAVPYLDYVECPSVNLTTGWIHDNNDHTPLRSLCSDPNATKHVRLYEVYLNNLLRSCLASSDTDDVLLKLKIDGVRLFAVYDGHDRLRCMNGLEIDLPANLPLRPSMRYTDLFSTDLVYQLEQLHDLYFITDVLDIRNRYVANIQPFHHGFSAAVPKYKKHPGQEWPYYLVGTELADRPSVVEAIQEAKARACHHNFVKSPATAGNGNGVGAAAGGGGVAQSTDNHDFVPVTVTHSREILHQLAEALNSLAPAAERKFHVNGFHQPSALFSTIVAKRFGRWQFLATYRRLIRLFSEHPDNHDAVVRLLERCNTNMFSADLDFVTLSPSEHDTPSPSLDWFYDLQMDRLFDHIDGLLLYRRARRSTSRRQTARCSFVEPLAHGQYEAFKIKTFQTIELTYSEQDGGRIKYFKTDNFYRKFYFKLEQPATCWKRFDQVEVRLWIPQRFLPLVPLTVYEILCESETDFYLVAPRPDKFVPDSNYKVNSIVFARQQLHDSLNMPSMTGGGSPTARTAHKKRASSSPLTSNNSNNNEDGCGDDDNSDTNDDSSDYANEADDVCPAPGESDEDDDELPDNENGCGGDRCDMLLAQENAAGDADMDCEWNAYDTGI